MCPKLYLLAGNPQNGIVIFRQDQFLEFLAALSVAAFADEEWRRLLVHRRGAGGGRQVGNCHGFLWGGGGTLEGIIFYFLDQQFEVGGGSPPASTDHPDPLL